MIFIEISLTYLPVERRPINTYVWLYFLRAMGCLMSSDLNHYPVDREDLSLAIDKRFSASEFSTATEDSLMEYNSGYRGLKTRAHSV